MPLNLIFTSADNNTLNDDGVYGNNTSVVRNGFGQVIYTFIHPADSIVFTTNGTPNINFNVNFTDSLGAANFTLGNLISPATSFNAITVNKIQTSGIVTLVANQAITESGHDVGVDITAISLILSAVTGIATPANALETQVSTLEAETVTGGISITNLGVLQVGGATADVAGLNVLSSGDINLTNTGSIFLADTTGTESIHGGSSSGNVTLIAKGINADIMSTVDHDAISAAGGNISLTAGRDIAFGVSGLDFDNDVRAKGSITVNAGHDFLIDGFSDLASDDFGTNSASNVIINAGHNIEVRSVTGTDGSIAAGGSVGADVILTTGIGGSVVLNAPSQAAVQSSSGDVIVNSDRMLISAMSGITANNGSVALHTSTAGYEINLGSATDSAFALELSDAELDRVFSPTLIVGNENSGNVTVASAISLNSANTTLRSGEDIVVAADLSNASTITLDAAHNFFHSAGVITTGVLTVLVDSANQGGGVGSLGNNIIASTIILSGNAGADVLTGSNVADIINGMGGNDTINGGDGITQLMVVMVTIPSLVAI